VLAPADPREMSALGRKVTDVVFWAIPAARACMGRRRACGDCRFRPRGLHAWLWVGIAPVLLLIAEGSLMLGLRGLSIHEYFANLDPAAGTVYYFSLGVFAFMPLAIATGCPVRAGRRARADRPVTVPLLHVRLAEQLERFKQEPTWGTSGRDAALARGRCPAKEGKTVPVEFKIGDHVSWNSEAGRVRGTIRRKITTPITFKGYTVRASKATPQYLIESDKTDHLAMHKGSVLRRLSRPAARRAASKRRRGRRRTES